jgi:hypothetical protein
MLVIHDQNFDGGQAGLDRSCVYRHRRSVWAIRLGNPLRRNKQFIHPFEHKIMAVQ